jgi:uncharacterized membrane protein YbaN (DUF454 family)
MPGLPLLWHTACLTRSVIEKAADARCLPLGQSEDPAVTTRWTGRRVLYFGLGWTFFALGVIGAVLPVVPTTPFMLLAAWAFSNSSRRFERWLLEHRWFGPGIQRWREHRVVPVKVKRVSYATMLLTFTLSLASGRVAWWALVAQGALMAYGAWFLAQLPSQIPKERRPLIRQRELG